MGDDAIEQARRWFAEELRLVARVRDDALVQAFATARRAPTTVLRTVPLPQSAFAPWGRSSAGASPPLRVSAGEGDHATPGLDPGDGGGGRPARCWDSLPVTVRLQQAGASGFPSQMRDGLHDATERATQ